MTITDAIFVCCLFVVGPAFGFVAAFRSSQEPFDKRFNFMFGSYAAYAGWFISGICAMLIHPGYPTYGPPEPLAMLYTLPGFLTGIAGLQLLRRMHRMRRDSHAS